MNEFHRFQNFRQFSNCWGLTFWVFNSSLIEAYRYTISGIVAALWIKWHILHRMVALSQSRLCCAVVAWFLFAYWKSIETPSTFVDDPICSPKDYLVLSFLLFECRSHLLFLKPRVLGSWILWYPRDDDWVRSHCCLSSELKWSFLLMPH